MEAAVAQSEVPLVVHSVREVDDRVKSGHGGFSERQVQQEIVGDGPHAFVRHNDPDHSNISYYGHENYATVCNGPEDDSPHWLHELVPVHGPVISIVGVEGPVWHIRGIE